MKVLQNSQKFRVLWHGSTEDTEVRDTGMNVIQNSQKFRVRVWKSYKTSRSCGYCGTGVQILQKFRVLVWMSYRTHISSLYGYGFCTKLTEVPGTGNTRLDQIPRGRSSIWSGGCHSTCVARSHWVSIPESICSCVGIIDDHDRGDKSWTSTSGDRGNSHDHGYRS